jgi:NADPH-dependent curcumin reductase CurA
VTFRTNTQIVLAKRPHGNVAVDCFATKTVDVPTLQPGEALLEVRYVGIDPTIRGWISERGSYMPPVEIGEVVRASGVGIVVETTDPQRYPIGQAYTALTGWQQYRVLTPDEFPPVTAVAAGVSLLDAMNWLGQIGMTAFLGVLDVARPKEGETFVVSAAASGVGCLAGQIAKIEGATVVGIAGTDEKCAWVVDDLGFDACINYKTQDVSAALKEHAPRGIDVYFDNVGGALLDTVLRRIANRGRVVLCGDLSTYDTDAPAVALHNVKYLMGRRARMEGFNTLDHWDRLGEAHQILGQWFKDGTVQRRDHIVQGLEHSPNALVRLFSGDHIGKLVVQVAPDE